MLDLKKTLLIQQPHAFLLRRTKSEVAELPPKNIVRLDCTMSEEEIAAHQALLRACDLRSGVTDFCRRSTALRNFTSTPRSLVTIQRTVPPMN